MALQCACGRAIDAQGIHLQSCKHFFKGRRHDILNATTVEMIRDAFPDEVQVKREPMLVELGGEVDDPSSRGDVAAFSFDGVRHFLVDMIVCGDDEEISDQCLDVYAGSTLASY